MTKKEVKEKVIKNIQWKTDHGGSRGQQFSGQHTGNINTEVSLISEEAAITITISHYRSQVKNRELAMTLFELALDDIIK